MLPGKAVARYCQLATLQQYNREQYSNGRSLLASTSYLPSEEVAISAANYNYNHYNLPFSHMIIVIISDEDMLKEQRKGVVSCLAFNYCLDQFSMA